MKIAQGLKAIIFVIFAIIAFNLSVFAQDEQSSIAILNSETSSKEYASQNLGSYSALFDDILSTMNATNLRYEVITEKALCTCIDPNKYKVIVIPMALNLPQNIINNLYDYLKEGGKIVITDPGGKYTDSSQALINLLGITVDSSISVNTETEVDWLKLRNQPEENTLPPGTKISEVKQCRSGDILARLDSYEVGELPAVIKSEGGGYIAWAWGIEGNINFNSFVLRTLLNQLVPGLTNKESIKITDRRYEDYIKEINQLQNAADGAVSTVIQADLSVPLTKIQERMYMTEIHKALFDNYFKDRQYSKAQQQFDEAKSSVLEAYARAIPSRLVEGRALWLDRGTIVSFKKPSDIKKLFDKIAEAGINVVYLETVNAGFPIYPSKYIKQNPLVEGLDPLAMAIKEAHDRDIELHAWTWIFAVGNTKHNSLIGEPRDYPGPVISNNFYDGAMLGMYGNLLPVNQPEYWIDPANPDARSLMLNVLEEIVTRYDVDGVQLDYIRYPFQSNSNLMGFDYIGREAFENETGNNLDNLNADTIDAWTQWKTEKISSFVGEASSRLRSIRPDIQISAAVYSGERKKRISSIQQDWESWIEQGWIDTLSPMSYATDSEKLSKLAGYVNETCQNKVLVYPGLAIRQLDTANFLEQLDTVRSMGMVGSTLFAMAHLNDDKIGLLQTGPYRNKSLVVPNRDPMKASSLLLEDFLVRVHRFVHTGKIFSLSNDQEQRVKNTAQDLYGLIQNASAHPTPENVDVAYNKSIELSNLVKDWLSFENNLRPGRVRLLTDYLNQLTSILAYAKHKQLTRFQVNRKVNTRTTSW